jgi:hypothetical protein
MFHCQSRTHIIAIAGFLLAISGNTALSDEPARASLSDSTPQVTSTAFRSQVTEAVGTELGTKPRTSARSGKKHYYRTPAMIGDFYAGNPLRFSANATTDRLFVFANDLDAPLVLPGAGSTLLITEPGPVGIFASSLTNIQQVQALLRAAAPLPPATLAATVADNATMTTSLTIGQIQTLLASTAAGYDIVSLTAPPNTYDAAVEAVFLTRNAIPGSVVYNSSGSGALLQGGTDTLTGGEDFDAFYFYDYVVRFNTVLADATSGGVGRMKIAEGGSVLPQNRVFFRYNYLSGVNYTNSKVNLNRFVPGFERTFGDGLFSVELRAPFATDTSTTATLDGSSFSNGMHTRFGNFTVYLKALLLEWDNFAMSGGLGIATPTADDVAVHYTDGTPLLRVYNESVCLQPFLGALYTPNRDMYYHSFFQVDTAANGNPVSINSAGTGLANAGKLTDSTNLYFDLGAGYWLYRSNASRGLTGIIPTVEIHQNSSLQSGDLISAGPFQISNTLGTTSLTNLVAGSTFQFGRATNLSTAYTFPLGGGLDRQYNGSLQVFLSHGR